MKPDREKRIYSNITGLYLAVRNDRLRWMTEDGYILPSHEELSEIERKRAENAESLLISERRHAEEIRLQLIAEQHRAGLLADKLRHLGISVE